MPIPRAAIVGRPMWEKAAFQLVSRSPLGHRRTIARVLPEID